MQNLTDEGRRVVEGVAQRHRVSVETVTALLTAVAAGQGGQAQFNIAELGGMGQWSRGGMTMVGDMFNHGLKARVDALCSELAGLVGGAPIFAASQSQSQGGAGRAGLFATSGGSGNWWPDALGAPSSTGAQNDHRYAVFPQTRRLAIDRRGRVTIHDTGDHRIGGVSQQQSGDQSLSFTSQHGLVRVTDLPVVDDAPDGSGPARGSETVVAAAPDAAPAEAQRRAPAPAPRSSPAGGDEDIFLKLERLADLRQKGILSEPEFDAKKAELLARL